MTKTYSFKVTAIVDAAVEGLASLTQQDFAAVRSFFAVITKVITLTQCPVPTLALTLALALFMIR